MSNRKKRAEEKQRKKPIASRYRYAPFEGTEELINAIGGREERERNTRVANCRFMEYNEEGGGGEKRHLAGPIPRRAPCIQL